MQEGVRFTFRMVCESTYVGGNFVERTRLLWEESQRADGERKAKEVKTVERKEEERLMKI